MGLDQSNSASPQASAENGRPPQMGAGEGGVPSSTLGPVSAAGQLAGTGVERVTSSQGIRFGSADSKDVDVVYPVSILPDPVECKAFCSDKSENRNLVVIRNGVVVESYKGLPDETNNALLATYHLHSQTVDLPITQEVIRNVPLKVCRSTRIILSHLSRSEYRDEIKQALRSNNLESRHAVLATIDFTRLELSADVAKSIAFQLAQASALIDGIQLYSKMEIQGHFPHLADLISRSGTSLGALNEQRDAYLEKLAGVYVRQKGSLNLLMYGNALAIKEWNQFARQCRGMVVDMARERCVCFPMDKFFRFGEGPELSREQISLATDVEVVEKVDGSMVSLIEHGGRRFFSCKGNFDTEQSRRAGLIAERLPIDQLQTDRYSHIFEVIYPENRFPHGLSIVDYGAREDLVLIAMRDRFTNQPLPYSEVIKEAQRVGLSHPRVFSGSLAEVFAKVDNDAGQLGHEGYVIRATESGRYFKLKYEGYKEVLRIVNEIRSDRFVREYVALSPDERQRALELLPEDIRRVAEGQLSKLGGVITQLNQYALEISAQGPDNPKECAGYVRATVPAELQRLVFQISRKLPARDLLERAAVEVYDGRRQVPQLAKQPEQIGMEETVSEDSNDRTNRQSSNQELRQSMLEDKRKPVTDDNKAEPESSKFDPLLVKTLRTFAGLPGLSSSPEQAKHDFEEVFKYQPIDPALIDYYLESEPAPVRSIQVLALTKVRGREILPWVEKLLTSNDPEEQDRGRRAMLLIDEDRSLDLMRQAVIEALNANPVDTEPIDLIFMTLTDYPYSEKCLALIEDLEKLPNFSKYCHKK